MQFLQHTKHENVELFRVGYLPIGQPFLMVYCYYLDGLLVDAGPRNCEKKVLAAFHSKPIQQIALTHWHEDHMGNTAVLAQVHQAKIWAHPITQDKLRNGIDLLPYEKFLFGKPKIYNGDLAAYPSVIETDNFCLTPIFTPGHATDHTVLLEKNRGWLFAGDLWVGVKIRVFKKGEQFWPQVESFKKVLEYEFDTLFCGHNPRLKNGKELLRQKLQYFEDFGGKVLSLHERGLNIAEIMKALGRRDRLLTQLLFSFDVSLANMVEAVLIS